MFGKRKASCKRNDGGIVGSPRHCPSSHLSLCLVLLDSEEQEYEVAAENFVPCENQTELRQMLMEAARNAIEARKTKKRPVFR